MSKIKSYVLGFAFDINNQNVLLIKKNRPEWQAGLLNGVGGKVEGDESSLEALVREFKEETDIDTIQSDWQLVTTMTESGVFSVKVYKTTIKDIYEYKSITDEKVWVYPLKAILKLSSVYPQVSNLKWLLHMCFDADLTIREITVNYE